MEGLPLIERLKKRASEPRCGLYIVDIRRGKPLHWVRLTGQVNTIFNIVALPEVRSVTAPPLPEQRYLPQAEDWELPPKTTTRISARVS